MIKAKVWARLTPIWALVPLSHYIAWIVPLRVNIFLPSNTLARPSLIVQNGRQNGTERKSSNFGFTRYWFPVWKRRIFNVPRQHQWIQGPRKHRKTYYTAKSAFSFVQLLAPNKQRNVIKANVWARLTPIWAIVPLSHYIAWIVPLWVNILLLSNTLARPSLIVQIGRQNGTVPKSSNFSFYELLIFHLKTNYFLRSKTAPMNSGAPKT